MAQPFLDSAKEEIASSRIMKRWVFRILVALGLLSLSACGLPGATARSLGTVTRTGESLGQTVTRFN